VPIERPSTSLKKPTDRRLLFSSSIKALPKKVQKAQRKERGRKNEKSEKTKQLKLRLSGTIRTMESLKRKLKDRDNYIKQLEHTLEEQRQEPINECEPKTKSNIPSVKDKRLKELENQLGELKGRYNEVKKKYKQLEYTNNELSEQLSEKAREEEESRMNKEQLTKKLIANKSENEKIKSTLMK